MNITKSVKTQFPKKQRVKVNREEHQDDYNFCRLEKVQQDAEKRKHSDEILDRRNKSKLPPPFPLSN